MTAKIIGTKKDPFSVNALENYAVKYICHLNIYNLIYVFIALHAISKSFSVPERSFWSFSVAKVLFCL